MLSKVMLGVIAGSVMSAAAYAGDDTTTPVTGVQLVPLECYSGELRPKMGRATGLIFDNSDTAANLVTNAANPAWVIDDHSLYPGNAASTVVLGPQTITGIAIGFAVRGLATDVRDFDVRIQFMDSYTSTAPAGTAGWSGQMGPTLIVSFVGIAGAAAYVTNLIDISGSPIPLNDDGFAISMRFVEPGTDTLVNTSAVPVTHLFQSALDGAVGATQSNLLLNGHNSLGSWRDVDNDTIVEVAERTTFAWPTNARFWGQLEGNARCPSDFNNDGFVDGIDADGFNNAFDAGC